MLMSQKDAVFAAITSVFAQSGRTFTDGEVVELTKEERATVTSIVVSAIENGDVSFSADAAAKYSSPEKLKAYVTGMVGNWLTKDKRLNGGEKYTPANPGSRAGQGDEVLKNLKALRTTTTDAEHLAAIDAEISKRKVSLSQAKVKKVEVNFDAIPADLLSKLNIAQ